MHYFKHVGSHGVSQFVLETFVFKVEFNYMLAICFLYYGEYHNNCALWNGLHCVRLAELNLVTIINVD